MRAVVEDGIGKLQREPGFQQNFFHRNIILILLIQDTDHFPNRSFTFFLPFNNSNDYPVPVFCTVKARGWNKHIGH